MKRYNDQSFNHQKALSKGGNFNIMLIYDNEYGKHHPEKGG